MSRRSIIDFSMAIASQGSLPAPGVSRIMTLSSQDHNRELYIFAIEKGT